LTAPARDRRDKNARAATNNSQRHFTLRSRGDAPDQKPNIGPPKRAHRAIEEDMKMQSKLVAAAATALAILGGGRAARATNYTITVDASNKTAGNPRFWVASVGTGTASLTLRPDLQTHYKLGARELGAQRVRGHGVLNDDMAIYKGPGSYSWTNFDKYLDAIVSAGMRPIMELDFMPTALALNGKREDIYKNATDYKNFIQAVVQHCVDKYTAADVGQWYWEIWNEPDYAGFWNGSNATEAVGAKMTEYYTLYDNAVAAITAVLPNALVGGPATTQSGPIQAFLQHCRTAGTRVTFASSHVYPGGANAGTTANAANLVSDNTSRVSGITGAGYTTAQVKSFNTEWNSSYNGQGGLVGDVVTSMDNHWNVGFILKGVKLLSDKNSGNTPALDVFSYWVLSDVFDESSGPSGSYILGKNGTLPFGQVFGLMTFQGMRKAAFNAFKMLAYLGPNRLMSTGGTSNDGVDAMATISAAGDEIQILVYDFYQTMNTTGTDMVTVTINNLPSTLAGKSVFGTQFVVDETHSNPYSTWVSQGKPTNPSEAQWQAMKAHQGLELGAAVGKTTLGTTFTSTITMNRQSGTLLILGVNRPVTGRNGLVEIEGEDYDGQSNASKEESGDIGLGQSINVSSGGSVFFNNVDFSDAGVGSVQLRVNAASATTLTLRADTATGTVIGTCNVAATGGSWATQTCALTPTAGVHTLYATAAGALRLNYLKFLPGGSTTGTGGMGGGAGGRGGAGGATGAGGAAGTGAGGSTSGAAGSGAGGNSAGSGGSGAGGAGMVGGAGGDTSVGTGGTTGSGGSGTGGDASTGSGGSGTIFGNGGSSGGAAGNSGSGGSAPPQTGGGGCACAVGDGAGPPVTLLLAGLGAAVSRLRKRRSRPAK
jgi:xylan 1,4-beta-xylosidase